MTGNNVKSEQVVAALSACHEVLCGAGTQRVLQLTQPIELGKALIRGIASGEYVIVPKSAVKEPEGE